MVQYLYPPLLLHSHKYHPICPSPPQTYDTLKQNTGVPPSIKNLLPLPHLALESFSWREYQNPVSGREGDGAETRAKARWPARLADDGPTWSRLNLEECKPTEGLSKIRQCWRTFNLLEAGSWAKTSIKCWPIESLPMASHLRQTFNGLGLCQIWPTPHWVNLGQEE